MVLIKNSFEAVASRVINKFANETARFSRSETPLPSSSPSAVPTAAAAAPLAIITCGKLAVKALHGFPLAVGGVMCVNVRAYSVTVSGK